MIRYTVTATIQSSKIDAGVPVDVNWYSGTSLAKALASMTSAAAHDESLDHGGLPESMRYRTLAVRFETEVLPDEPTVDKPEVERVILDLMSEHGENVEYDRACIEIAHDLGIELPGHPYEERSTTLGQDTLTYETTFDDSVEYALSDCAWYDNQYQPWTRFDCSGRMATVTLFRNGETVTAAMMCEGHVNAYHQTEA